MEASDKRNGEKPAKPSRRLSSSVAPDSSSALNGYNSVMCAGMPAAADGSCRSRKGLTRPSASGTNTTSADSIVDIYSRFALESSAATDILSEPCKLLHHALIHRPFERDDQVGKVPDRLPAPGDEFLLVAGGALDVDLVVLAGEAHRDRKSVV